jgi:predicted phage terminase large subunit-like protein
MQSYNGEHELSLSTSEWARLRLIDPELYGGIEYNITIVESVLKVQAQESERLVRDLKYFFQQAWTILEPQTPLIWTEAYDFLCEWLTFISSGDFKKQNQEKKGLIINIPPRMGKSTLVSIVWPVWTWLHRPSMRFLCASYSGTLSKNHNQKRRDLIASRWFQRYFKDKFTITVDRQDQLINDKTGYFVATSVGGSSTGFGGDVCVGDDLLSRDERYSPTAKAATISWLDGSFDKLLNTRTTSVFVHISQRLADDDPTGHLLGEDDAASASAVVKRAQWEHVKIKREATDIEQHPYPSFAKDERIYERPKGDILQPARNPPHVIAEMKLNTREWSGQEQQEPTPSTGIVFQPSWWQNYKRATPLPNFDLVVVSVDCAFKDKKDSDYVAIHKWGVAPQRRMLLDRYTENIGYSATKAHIKAMLRAGQVPWSLQEIPAATLLLIEDKANGSAVIEELRRDPEINVTIIALPGNEGKNSRTYAASADVEALICWLPEDAEWYGPFTKLFSQWAGEGTVLKDDDIDAACQFLNYSRNRFSAVTAGAIFRGSWSEALLYPTEGEISLSPEQCLANAQVSRFISLFYSTAGMQVLLDVIDDGKTIWIDREFVYDARLTLKQKANAEHSDDLQKFLVGAENAQTVLPIDCPTFQQELVQRGVWVTTCEEDKSNAGIKLVNSLMAAKLLRVNRACTTLVQQIGLAHWDSKKREAGVEEMAVMNCEAVTALCRVIHTKIPAWRLTA